MHFNVKYLQPVFFIFSIFIAIWAATTPYFRNNEELLLSAICLPLSFSVALFILAASVKRNSNKSFAWLALLVVGQAAALQLIHAGNLIGYQHYKTINMSLTDIDFFCLAIIALQACITFIALKSTLKKIYNWIFTHLNTWKTIAILLAITTISIAPSFNRLIQAQELLLASFIQIVNILTLILLLKSIPQETLGKLTLKFHQWFGDPDSSSKKSSLDRFAIIISIIVVVISALLNIFVYEQHPHIPDEVTYLIQASYFSQGMLSLPPMLVPEAFNIDLMLYESSYWYSIFPPGWPAALAVGSYLGAPWLVNPVLAGICTLLIYLLAQELFNRFTARLITLLFCFSPWFIFLAMSYMAHTMTLTCAIAASYAVARMRKSPEIKWAILAGSMIGLTSLIRPMDGLILALILGFWALGIKTWKQKLKLIPVLGLTTLLTGAITLPYNEALTGSATEFPVMTYFNVTYSPGVNSLGFGPDKGLHWGGLDPYKGHGLRDVINNNRQNTFAVNIELFGWSTGSLILVIVFLFSGTARKKDYWMLWIILTVAGFHSLYWFNGGPDFGARYWYLMIFPAIALSVRGLFFIGKRLPDEKNGMTQAVTGVIALSIVSTINFLPWRSIDKYFHYRNMQPGITQLAKQNDFSNGLILVKGNRFPDYMSVASYNLTTPEPKHPIYAWDKDLSTRKKLLQAYPNRVVWLVHGPSITGSSYKLVSGPVSGKELLNQKVLQR